jgi:hypothetical protein
VLRATLVELAVFAVVVLVLGATWFAYVVYGLDTYDPKWGQSDSFGLYCMWLLVFAVGSTLGYLAGHLVLERFEHLLTKRQIRSSSVAIAVFTALMLVVGVPTLISIVMVGGGVVGAPLVLIETMSPSFVVTLAIRGLMVLWSRRKATVDAVG